MSFLTTWGAFDLPESESGFEIMILIHRFISANRKRDFELGGSYSAYDFIQDSGDGCYTVLFKQIRNMIPNQVIK